ncbi:MAG: endonuclease MutS2 [Lachnospiraceae bacterium]|nr:endonuclease MutS2 [Ruminococcus sp.]MCM1275889.1 endonuclease MutS2 [Lachnospiraceae bacterium]
MNKYYKKLELDKILELLAEQTVSDGCRERALKLKPVTDFEKITEELQKTDDAFTLSAKFGTPAFRKIKDVSGSLKRAETGSMLSFRELLDTAAVLRETAALCDWFSQCENVESSLAEYFRGLVPVKALERRISESIVSEEEMSDAASAELASIRKRITRQGLHIREQLDGMIKNKNTRSYLQDAVVTMRDGRYVVPVRSEHKNDVPGLVHDTSATGQTFFIEPMSVVEANNEIRVLKAREQAEIERITREMSAEVGENAAAIAENYRLSQILELYFAKANLGAKMRAATPKIVQQPKVILNNARHPLLDRDLAVPISVEIGEKYDCLIITGPNTGGKTVAIKTVGLLTLMAQCGLMVPAQDGSVIGCFDRVYVDIGDEQSIEQSLSTFSSHMTNVIRIIDAADENSLVLIDELGSGTDPVEGAALAVSILAQLKSYRAKVLATTHYQEVKMFALETEGVENASCEFDVETLKPTYRLIVGVPGKSNAFAITKKLGMSDYVISRAEELVSTENRRFEKIIDQLEQSRKELEQLRESVAVSERNAKLTESELKQKLSELEAQKEKELENARQRAISIIEQTRAQSNMLLNELEELKKAKDKEELRKGLSEAKSRVGGRLNKMQDEANPVIEKKLENYVPPRPFKQGDTVKLADTGREGTLLSVPNMQGQCFVQVGSMRVKTNAKNLRLVEKKAQDRPKQSGKITKSVTSNLNRRGGMELDIRGYMGDDGVMEVERFIDGAIMSGLSQVVIIHGKGTGALREAVHAALRRMPVKSFRLGAYGEGEAGVTVVDLK